MSQGRISNKEIGRPMVPSVVVVTIIAMVARVGAFQATPRM